MTSLSETLGVLEDTRDVRALRSLVGASGAFSLYRETDDAHITVSCLVISPDGSNVLLMHHAKLQSWLQPGGHVDRSDTSLAAAARREVLEETGQDVPAEEMVPVSVDIHALRCDGRQGLLHHDIQYAAFASENTPLGGNHESTDLRWFPIGSPPPAPASVTRLIQRSRQIFGLCN